MKLRTWIGHGPEIKITLTEQPEGHAKAERLHRAVAAFTKALSEPDPIAQGDTVECIDAWDTFNNLTVGKLYEVVRAHDGMIFVSGDHGHIGGWLPYHFKHVVATEHS